MKKIKATLSALALSMTLCAPVLAQPHTPVISNTLSAHDLEMAFENAGEPMELALLSEQEMRETKGAWFYLYGQLFGGAALGSMYYFYELFDASPGSFSWDGLAAYMTVGSLAGIGGVGYTVPGRIILSGSTAGFVQHHYSP